jgi:hypothetical protein
MPGVYAPGSRIALSNLHASAPHVLYRAHQLAANNSLRREGDVGSSALTASAETSGFTG